MTARPLRIVPKGSRVATAPRVVKQVVQSPRCAAMTARGQCTGTVGGTGAESGWAEVDGQRVPLCGRHFPARDGYGR